MAPLVTEDKIVFGLNAKAASHLTLAKIRKLYSRADNKSIAKQVIIIVVRIKIIFCSFKNSLLSS